MKIELGCGQTKKDDYVGVDLIPEADVQEDMYDYLKSLEDNSVEAIRAIDSLEHIPQNKFLKLMNEILRVCKNGAIIEIRVPYHTQSVNIANPYHLTYFNEHTFRFFCRESQDKYNVIKKSSLIRDYSFGLWHSANEGALPGYVRIRKIQYDYLPQFENKSEEEKEFARLHYNNAILDMNIELEIEK